MWTCEDFVINFIEKLYRLDWGCSYILHLSSAGFIPFRLSILCVLSEEKVCATDGRIPSGKNANVVNAFTSPSPMYCICNVGQTWANLRFWSYFQIISSLPQIVPLRRDNKYNVQWCMLIYMVECRLNNAESEKRKIFEENSKQAVPSAPLCTSNSSQIRIRISQVFLKGTRINLSLYLEQGSHKD